MSDALDMTAMVAELRRDEGEVLHAYEDHLGYLTIGVGRLIDKAKSGGISKEESAFLLANDIAWFMSELDTRLPWWRTLDGVRQRVLLNMAFNMGVEGLLKFTTTLKAVKEGRWDDAASGMIASKWAGQVGMRAVRLAKMMRTGE